MNKGFSLIEVLVALAFLTIVSLSVIQLVTRARQAAEVARQDFVAANLAREGLELVRAVRDTNWFASSDRSLWIQDDMCDTFTYDSEMLREGADVGSEAVADLYIQDNDEWTHSAAGESTPYQRVLTVDCNDKDSDPAFVTVTAEVRWQNRGLPHEVVLKEKLYNWLP